MGEIQDSLKGWRKSKGWRQEDLADKLGEPRPTYQSWETGRTPSIPPDVQGKLRKMGYKGPWPREEAQEALGGPYVTREEFAEEKGALKAEIRLLREALEKMGEAVRELAIRDRERGSG